MKKAQTFTCVLAFLMAGFFCGIAGAGGNAPENASYPGEASKRGSAIIHDTIEDDPRYQSVFANIEAEVDDALKDHPMRGAMGFCHIIWETKKNILMEKYGIHWQSPAELNPQILFD